ncbi:MAG: lactate racemase domain-containing protein [Aureliella sp.]
MTALEIHFGKNSTWTLPSDERFASTLKPATTIEDWTGAVNASLSSPIDFPSLDQALVPGDQLVLAVDPATPALVEVVAATVQWFCERGTAEANVRIVLAGDGQWSSEELAERINQRSGFSIVVERHNLDEAEQVAYVAANEASDPIYLNRSLVDADVVIPISAARPRGSMDYFGPFGIFPLLSNRETRGKFHSLPSLADSHSHAQLRGWADQAAWWVGVLVGIQVIPAGDDRASGILAGQLESLEAAAQTALAEQWNQAVVDSPLVVAVIDGPPQSQSWLSVARALATAQEHVAPGGAIVLVTQLSQAVGSGLGRLRDPHQSPESIAKKLAHDASDDALAAAMLLQATSNNHVYLISSLRSDTVESLGMGVIADGTQLTRLLEQFPSCTILEAVQHRGIPA